MKGPVPENLVGKVFGKLTVVGFAGYGKGNSNKKDRMWLCKCECGNEKTVRTQSLKQGKTKTCGLGNCHPRGKYGITGKKDRERASNLAILYNLNPGEYEKMLAFQKGVCAISGKPPKNTRLAIDHDHTTGKIRGLLYWHMNKSLSAFNDDPKLLRAAADYLENPPATFALGEEVYGMLGRVSKKKKNRKYGPSGSKERQPRKGQ
jgi:hypothetical protein